MKYREKLLVFPIFEANCPYLW